MTGFPFCFSTERNEVLEQPMSAAEDPAQGRNSSNSAELDQQTLINIIHVQTFSLQTAGESPLP